MRSALLLSIVSIVLLGLIGWMRHDSPRSSRWDGREVRSEDDALLFVG
jgi:hypothetical protein